MSRISPFTWVVNIKNMRIRMWVIGELRKSGNAVIIVDRDSNYNYSEKDSILVSGVRKLTRRSMHDV